MNPVVNYGLWGVTMCQCTFTTVTLLGDTDNGDATPVSR